MKCVKFSVWFSISDFVQSSVYTFQGKAKTLGFSLTGLEESSYFCVNLCDFKPSDRMAFYSAVTSINLPGHRNWRMRPSVRVKFWLVLVFKTLVWALGHSNCGIYKYGH